MPLIRAKPEEADRGAEVVTIDRAHLHSDLESPDRDLRRDAVRRAARRGEAELLADHLSIETDPGIREMILTSLVRIGGIAAIRPLVDLLGTDQAALRGALIETLQSMGDAIVPEIEVLLRDDNPDLRIYAVNMLLSLRSPRVPDLALKVIETDPHVNVCAAAVDVLMETGRPDMVDALHAVANRFLDHPFLAFAVRAAIKRIG
jgi:HEAT repeat protein